MASSSDNDNSSPSDNEDSVFFDAKSNLPANDFGSPPLTEPRWRVSSRVDSSKLPEHLGTNSLTEKQVQDLTRRHKLAALRDDESDIPRIQPTKTNSLIEVSSGSLPSIEHRASSNQDTSTKSGITLDENDDKCIKIPQQKSATSMSSVLLSSSFSPKSMSHLSYHTLTVPSSRGTTFQHLENSAIISSSEPNMMSLSDIDHLTKYGEFPNSRKLNDEEILMQPIVLNLDNGTYVRLGEANPMALTMMQRIEQVDGIGSQRPNAVKRTHGALRRSSSDNMNFGKRDLDLMNTKQDEDDNESTSSGSSSTKSSHITTASSLSVVNKSFASAPHSRPSIGKQFKKLVLKNFFRKKKQDASHESQNPVDIDEDDDDAERLLINDGSNGDLKYKASRHLKEHAQFDKTQLLQTIVDAHNGPIWCMKFSPDGYLLATGGQDCLLKIWLLKSARPHFNEFSRLTSSQSKQQDEALKTRFHEFHQKFISESTDPSNNSRLGLHEAQVPLYTKPFCELSGHQAAVLDVAWSKSSFLLSSSMDKTVRLWHLTRLECLCYFLHVDFVSAIAFHPRDDRYFVSASLDGHLRLWNIPDKRVVYWSLIPAQASTQISAAEANLITAVNFCDEGRKLAAGTFDGRFLFYTDTLKYDTVINIGDKESTRNHLSKKRRKPSKITGIEIMSSNNSKLLITSNDSRIRLYDIRTKEIECKYRGYSNQSSQIRASFSYDDKYIISGSEDGWFYIWRIEPSVSGAESPLTTKTNRKQQRNFDRAFERIRVHNTMVTSAIFAPNPFVIMNYLYSSNDSSPSITRSNIVSTTSTTDNHRTRLNDVNAASNSSEGSTTVNNAMSVYVMVTADSKGQLKLLVNRFHR